MSALLVACLLVVGVAWGLLGRWPMADPASRVALGLALGPGLAAVGAVLLLTLGLWGA